MKRLMNQLERWIYSSQKNNEFHNYLSLKLKKSTVDNVGFMIMSDKEFSVLINIIKKEHDIYNGGEIIESKEFFPFHDEHNGYVFADFDLNIRDECQYDIIEIKYPPTCRICM